AACRDRLTEDIVPGGRTRSLGTVNRYLAAFSHVITVAMKEWGWIDHNLAHAVAKFKEAKGRTRYLSDEERSRLLAACKNSKSQYLFPIVVVAIATGMRKQEILSLTWKNINLERGVAYLFETYNSEPRAVSLAEPVLGLLTELHDRRSNISSFVFPIPDVPKSG
ncbi:MAG: site-specific integrase, partial [Alphaproteobacteria bacterium]|nr:site-specific integrase [Alphaproteobacteria bacterium]